MAPFQLLRHVGADKHHLSWSILTKEVARLIRMQADMTVYQPGNFLYNILIKKSKYVIIFFKREVNKASEGTGLRHDKTCNEIILIQVKLMKQVKEEADKIKASELRRNKEVAQLKKEQVKKESLIRNLEKEKKQKEVVLKRKQEEVSRPQLSGVL